MILLKSSNDYAWAWSNAASEAEAESIFANEFSSLYKHLKSFESQLRKRQDQGRFWWELRSCAFYKTFVEPKIFYQQIQFYPSFSFSSKKCFSNNKVSLLPTADLYLAARPDVENCPTPDADYS